MNPEETIEALETYKARLTGEVIDAFQIHSSSFGYARFTAWRKSFSSFLDETLPGESRKLSSMLISFRVVIKYGESELQSFWREFGEKALAFIDSLILDIANGEYKVGTKPEDEIIPPSSKQISMATISRQVFIVHGHDKLKKVETARFIERLGFEAIILHEQPSGGRTIIEKIEQYTDVGFAIILYTADDMGNTKDEAAKGTLKQRARQNVVFEHGYLMAKLGRDHVVPLVSGLVELPSDIGGIVYMTEHNWQIDLAREMQNAGYAIDFSKIVGS